MSHQNFKTFYVKFMKISSSNPESIIILNFSITSHLYHLYFLWNPLLSNLSLSLKRLKYYGFYFPIIETTTSTSKLNYYNFSLKRAFNWVWRCYWRKSCNRGVVGNAVGKQKAQPYVDSNLDPILLVPDIVGLIVKAVDNSNAKEERV